MNDITKRFIEVYEYFKKQGSIKNAKDFAVNLDVSNSLITEICNGRTNAGITPIQKLIEKYPHISADWLLTGRNEMLYSVPEKQNVAVSENLWLPSFARGTNDNDVVRLRRENVLKDEIIEAQRDTIESNKETISAQKMLLTQLKKQAH